MPEASLILSPHQSTPRNTRRVEDGIDSEVNTLDNVEDFDDDDDDDDRLEPVRRLVKIKPRASQVIPGAYVVTPFARNDTRSNSHDDLTISQEDDSIMIDRPDEDSVSTNTIQTLVSPTIEEYGDAKKYWSQKACSIGGVILMVITIISVGVGVGFSLSRPAASSTTQSHECSMSRIIDQCTQSKLLTRIPVCVMERYTDLNGNFIPKLAVSFDSNSCSAENLALISMAFFTSENDSLDHLTNRFGLSILFFATNGHHWSFNSGWITATDPCEWHGIECGSSNGVEAISLSSNTLHGYLPSNLPILLTDLRSVLVEDNGLTGTLPVEFSNLENINVGYNKLVGTVPSMIFASTKIVSLVIKYNKFDVSPIPVSFPGTQWRELLLNGVNFEPGPLPAGLFALTTLSHLDISFTNRHGTLPSAIGQLTNLEKLSLNGNQFLTTLPSEIGNVSRLSELFLSECTLSGTMPSELGRLTDLTSLSMDENNLYGTMPSEIGHLSNLAEFSFNDNRLSGTIPPEVCALRKGNVDLFGSLTTSLDYDAYQILGGLTCSADLLECCEMSR